MHFRIITKPNCIYCERAKMLMKIKGDTYEEDVRTTPEQLEAFVAEGYRTFPQIFLDQQHIGGFQGLERFYTGLPDDNF